MGRNRSTIDAALEPLSGLADLPAAVRVLRRRQPSLGEDIVAAVLPRVDGCRDSADPQARPLFERHLVALVDEYLRLLGGEVPSAANFVERYAREAAERGLPLESLLNAYRVGLQFLLAATTDVLLDEEPRDAVGIVSAATGFLLEFINGISSAASEHYLDQYRLLADVSSDQRSELLTILLGGYDESDRRVSTILRDAGYLDRRLKFCIVVAQSIDPSEMHRPARARRLADAIDRVLAHIPGERLIDTRGNKVTIVFSHRHRLSGWSPPREPLPARVAGELLKIGPAARVGVSDEVDSTAQIPAAWRQASLAFAAASVGRRVVRFAEVPLQRLLLHFAGEELAQVMPDWAARVHAADRRARGRLSATLRAYAARDMNLLSAARELGVHANTVYARFNRIAELSGRDPRRFDELNELLIVVTGIAAGQPP